MRATSTRADEAGFAYSNGNGSMLLMPSKEKRAGVSQFSKAVCADGKSVPLAYKKFKLASKSDNGRQTSYNFDQDGGELFQVEGTPIGDSNYCVVGSPKFFTERVSIKVTQEPANKNCDAKQINSLENTRHRKITWCRQQWKLGDVGDIVVAQFKKQKKQDLGVLAVFKGSSIAIKDYPSDTGAWRAESESDGTFSVEGLSILYAYETKTKLLGLAIAWGGPEGNNLEIAEAKDGKFDTLVKGYFYWAPL